MRIGLSFPSILLSSVVLSTCVYFQAWNPASEDQAFDRCHRLGQTKDVIITKVIPIIQSEHSSPIAQSKHLGLKA